MAVELIKLRTLDPRIPGGLFIYECWQGGDTHKEVDHDSSVKGLVVSLMDGIEKLRLRVE